MVNDPNSVLDTLTREIVEVGPDGQEVVFVHITICMFSVFVQFGMAVNKWLFFQVKKVVPAISDEVKDALIKNIRRRMTPQPLKIRADIEMKCFQFDGVLHIKVSILQSFIWFFFFNNIASYLK